MEWLFKRQIQKAMLNTFAGDCLVMPENPYSIDNPDILIRKGIILYAIYVPMFQERNNFDHLLRRVFSSELSYGSRLHTVLVLKEDDKLSGYGERVLNSAFCHIARGVNDVVRYVSSRENVGRNWSHIGDVKQWFHRQYDINNFTINFSIKEFGQQELLDNHQFKLENVSSPSWFGNGKIRVVKNVVRYKYNDVFIKKKLKKQSFREGFDNIRTLSFLKSFFIDDGYLVPNNNVVDDILSIATDWDLFSVDNNPNDYYRTLVFSGILPLNILDEKKLSYIHNYYIDIQNRMRYEYR